MQIVIPMSGMGNRFINAGYKAIKPLISVEGKPIIQHIVERFSDEDDFIFICSENHLRETNLRSILSVLKPNGKIISIKPHKLGPVYAVLKAKEYISLNQPIIVNYCDFSWRWNYSDFKKAVIENDCDGSVISYKGFHPHLLGNNKYASMENDNEHWMIEIREKYTFTENKMDCYQSSGTYYFKNGSILLNCFQELINNQTSLYGEYYVSLVYNELIKKKMKVYIYEIPIFLQWGTPDDLEEYLYWSSCFLNKENIS